jgi:diguanylate cyclase (GGDEF)-like protein
MESVRIRDQAGLPSLGGPLNNMGNVFLLQDEPSKALESFERALAAHRKNGNRQDEIVALGNIGRTYEAMGQLERARESHAAAVRMAREIAMVHYEAPALAKLGRTWARLGELDHALETLERAKRLSEERSGAFREEVLLELAHVYFKVGRLEEAEEMTREILETAERLADGEMQRGAHELLARNFEASERWREALDHHKRYHQLRLEHDRDLFSGRTRALQVQHEVEQAEHEQRLLRTKNEELTEAYGELQALHAALQDQAEELERLSHEDPLTGLHNRRSLEKRLIEERARIERYGGTFSLMVCDIDDFKATNDEFSHAIGDEVLERVGWILRTSTRDADVPARFGGEEFVVLLPATSLTEAAIVAEKIRQVVETYPWGNLAIGLTITVSMGVAEAKPSEPFETVFTAADAELYRAKAAGKNRISVVARKRSL